VLVPADRWSVTGADLETALSGVLDRVNRLEAAFESLTLAAYDSANRVLGGRAAAITAAGAGGMVAIGNDWIDAGGGNDVVAGDTGIIMLPLVAASAVGSGNVIDAALESRLAAKAAADAVTLAGRLAEAYGGLAGAGALNGAQAAATGLVLEMGNDTLLGGDGDDILVGDLLISMEPVSVTGDTSVPVANGLQNAFLRTVDRLFYGNISRALVGANSSPAAQITGAAGWWGLGSAAGVLAGRGGSYTLSSDVISGGAGRDFLLGDSGAIL